MTSPSTNPAPITTVTEELRQQWLKVLGPFPQKTPLKPQIVSTAEEPDHTRYLVRYNVEAHDITHAFLLIPKKSPLPAPGAIVFHGTSNDHIFQPPGLANSSTRHIGLHLVRRGYVVLAPQCFIYGYKENELTTRPRTFSDFTSTSKQLLKDHPGWTGMGKMLWDGMRAVDYMESRAEVDHTRIICIGHSLGAKQVLYLTAFDERIRAGIASEGGVGLSLSNWEAPWYLGAQIKQPGFAHDHHELLAMMAPRGIGIVGGGSADGVHSQPFIDAARPVFDLHGQPGALRLFLHDKGHDFPDETRAEAFDWLDSMLTQKQRRTQ